MKFWCVLGALFLSSICLAQYELKDHDRVVFLGDSNTAAGGYIKVLEQYQLVRFPKTQVKFINSGVGGDTADGAVKRLERDVFKYNPTVLVVLFGMNDIGWGTKIDSEHKQLYLNGIQEIISQSKKRFPNLKIFIVNYPCSGGALPNVSVLDSALQEMGKIAMTAAESQGALGLDVATTFCSLQKTALSRKAFFHAEDGVHLNPLGHQALAFAIMKAWQAPQIVSSVSIDASKNQITDAKGAQVSGLSSSVKEVRFKRLDAGLPLDFGALQQMTVLHHIGFTESVNQYLLKITGLDPQASYAIFANGKKVSKQSFSGDAFAQGINLAGLSADPWWPTTPWGGVSLVASSLVEARQKLETSSVFARDYLTGLDTAELESLRQANLQAARELERLYKQVTSPHPIQFEIKLETNNP